MAFQMVAPNAPAHELDALGWAFGAGSSPEAAVALPLQLASLFTPPSGPFSGSPPGPFPEPPRPSDAPVPPGAFCASDGRPMPPLPPPLPLLPPRPVEGGGSGNGGGGDGGSEGDEGGDQGIRAAKSVLLEAMASLACNLTAKQGRAKLRHAAVGKKAAHGAAGCRAAGARGRGGWSSVEQTPSAQPAALEVSFGDGGFYVESFRRILSTTPLGLEDRRFVHCLFEDAEWPTDMA
mmetsp:Transcript_31782/g.71527  ORF Transcript_31782/g.71527 Transcript_31782/m.71527 type:complete len:235 (-) Transcript_31782:202-906(-)